jgi:hypothetical protein
MSYFVLRNFGPLGNTVQQTLLCSAYFRLRGAKELFICGNAFPASELPLQKWCSGEQLRQKQIALQKILLLREIQY